ncbi:unnamed protein product [Mytilus edulis]|uniref:Uncharacterized protein n=1 Tax=Mytilus edulis TaxID=6550 RepID=A0A8S3VIP6_MYTED|nr:unnamed protein product [Mytilus edulis]
MIISSPLKSVSGENRIKYIKEHISHTRTVKEISSQISSQILEQVETNSQSQTSKTEMTLSQVSDASVVQFSRLESLNNFLSICNVSPVKRLTNLLLESSKRTVKALFIGFLQNVLPLFEQVLRALITMLWKDPCIPNVRGILDTWKEEELKAIDRIKEIPESRL